jgi:DNA-binding response OmpR family regulator
MTHISTTTPVKTADAGTTNHQGRILVVEDERHIARFLEYVLRREGYHVAVENDAEHALETARSFCPNAWLLDMVLPGMSGIDLLRILRREPNGADLIVVILSAHWFGQDEEMLREAGASAQCAKPIAPTTLIKKLRDLGVFPAGSRVEA